jgi:hypothetical protein
MSGTKRQPILPYPQAESDYDEVKARYEELKMEVSRLEAGTHAADLSFDTGGIYETIPFHSQQSDQEKGDSGVNLTDGVEERSVKYVSLHLSVCLSPLCLSVCGFCLSTSYIIIFLSVFFFLSHPCQKAMNERVRTGMQDFEKDRFFVLVLCFG